MTERNWFEARMGEILASSLAATAQVVEGSPEWMLRVELRVNRALREVDLILAKLAGELADLSRLALGEYLGPDEELRRRTLSQGRTAWEADSARVHFLAKWDRDMEEVSEEPDPGLEYLPGWFLSRGKPLEDHSIEDRNEEDDQ